MLISFSAPAKKVLSTTPVRALHSPNTPHAFVRLGNVLVSDTFTLNKLLGNFVLSMETNMDKASVLNALEITERGYTYIGRYPQLINSITVQDIIKTANKYFNDKFVFTMVGPKQSIEKL